MEKEKTTQKHYYTNKICDKNMCTGCGMCANICPKKCINLQEQEDGFIYPVIDDKQCINCQLCKINCPSNNKRSYNTTEPVTIAAFYENPKILQQSTSGGIFFAIAECILERNGKIYGAVMDNKLSVHHSVATNERECEKMQGSKYIQSDTKYTYQNAKTDLEEGKYVLYIGTPCQIAGLYAFLKNKYYEKLVTIDLICHGVGSEKLFKKYIKYLEQKYKQKVTTIKFRSKKNGYGKFTVEIILENGKSVYIASINDIYMSMYYKKGIYRESCYNCQYAKIPRIGNISIGDFRSLSEDSEVYKKSKNRGVSVILLNNKKGEEIFEKIKNKLCYEERELYEIISTNHNVSKPTIRPQYRDLILDDKEENIKKLQRKYCKRLKRELIAEFIGSKNVKIIKRIIRMKNK